MLDSTIAVGIGAISAGFAGVGAFFANRASRTATEIKTNGVTHVIAQITPTAPVVTSPLKSIVVDGTTYLEVKGA